MELIYLWVEDYKNIKQEGFVFSSKYKCIYNNETKELKIDKKSDYIENFFGEDIDITAIVGENGSGKSNLLESILCIMFENSIPWDNYKISAIFYDNENSEYFEKYINYSIDKVNGKYLFHNHKDRRKAFTFHYNYSLDYIKNDENNINFNKLYHKNDNYKTPILLQPNKSESKVNLWLMDYLANQDMLSFITHEKIKFDNIDNFFEPTHCKLDFDYSYIYGKKNSSLFQYMNNLSKEGKLNIFDTIPSYGLEDYSSKLEYITRDGLILLTYYYILKKIHKKQEYIINQDLKTHIKDDNYNKPLELLKEMEIEELFKPKYDYDSYKISQSLKFIKFLEKQDIQYKIFDDKIDIFTNEELLLNLAPWISIEFFDVNKVSFYSLSYGQRFLIKFLYSLLNQITKLSVHTEYDNIILILDEVEMGLHPQWQKEFFSLLLKVINTFKSRFQYQIIVTSHSPFILSDLPKENVILLKKGTQTQEFRGMQTFGANIHTLLSNGFFMQDGLIGQFAKEKINEVIDNLRDKKDSLTKKQIESTISLIGEPFIHTKLEQMYSEKFGIEDELEELKKQKTRIDSKIKELEKKTKDA